MIIPTRAPSLMIPSHSSIISNIAVAHFIFDNSCTHIENYSQKHNRLRVSSRRQWILMFFTSFESF